MAILLRHSIVIWPSPVALKQLCCVCYFWRVPRKTITANVSLPPEIHAWVKAKIAAILEAEPAANPTFTSVVSQALRQAMNEEKEGEPLLAETPERTMVSAPLEGDRKVRHNKKKRSA